MIENAAMPQAYSWLVGKRFLIIFSIATGLLSGIAMTQYYVSTETERVELETSELLNLELGSYAITSNLKVITTDLMFLAEQIELEGMFGNGDHELLRTLAEEFQIFITHKGVYDQIRYLDEQGKEIVRVDYNNGNPSIVPEDQLQNKANRYYFEKIRGIGRDEVYISPFDLNVEHGRIEQPAKPMIRFGIRLFDHSGRRRGILLFNYLGNKLVRDFKRAAANISDHVMLLNADGFWLSSPRREDEWGFMYNNDQTFQKVCPDAWRRIRTQNSGQFRNEEGMFSFMTIYPLSYTIRMRWSTETNDTAAIDEGYYWKVVSHVSPQLLTSARHDFFNQQLPFYLATLGLLVVASLSLAGALVRREQAATQVELERRVRGRLEEKVEERTRELKDTQVEKDRVVQQLIQAEKMAAIGTMASGIGHEINNPLYAILGMAEAIRDGEDISQCRGYGQDIITHSKHIAEIVRNLSGYVQPAQAHDLEVVDVNEKLAEAVAMARRSLLSDDVEIRENLTSVSEISAKSEEIQQVFFNVIRNGIQAMQGKGNLEISSEQEGNQVSIRIRDTGVGIAAEHMEKIYDPFFTTKGPDEGEGLGLYIVQQIVKKYAGTITYESEKGKGTVCTIQFPIGEKTERRNRNVAQDLSCR